jgi:hypothetical protein
MKQIVLNLRGTGGSGKSSAVRSLMDCHGIAQELKHARTGKTIAYRLRSGVVVVGRYQSACGGCDALSTFAEVADYVRHYSESAPVVFEGFLWSGIFKSSHNLAEGLSGTRRVIFATLDTPLDVCVERVKQRRAAAGNLKPFDPRNIASKYWSVIKAHIKLERAGWDTRLLPHSDTLPTMLRWLESA